MNNPILTQVQSFLKDMPNQVMLKMPRSWFSQAFSRIASGATVTETLYGMWYNDTDDMEPQDTVMSAKNIADNREAFRELMV